jgi:hypothetical protein
MSYVVDFFSRAKKGKCGTAGTTNRRPASGVEPCEFDLLRSGLLGFQFLPNPAQFYEIQGGHRAKHAAEHDHHNAVH